MLRIKSTGKTVATSFPPVGWLAETTSALGSRGRERACPPLRSPLGDLRTLGPVFPYPSGLRKSCPVLGPASQGVPAPTEVPTEAGFAWTPAPPSRHSLQVAGGLEWETAGFPIHLHEQAEGTEEPAPAASQFLEPLARWSKVCGAAGCPVNIWIMCRRGLGCLHCIDSAFLEKPCKSHSTEANVGVQGPQRSSMHWVAPSCMRWTRRPGLCCHRGQPCQPSGSSPSSVPTAQTSDSQGHCLSQRAGTKASVTFSGQ